MMWIPYMLSIQTLRIELLKSRWIPLWLAMLIAALPLSSEAAASQGFSVADDKTPSRAMYFDWINTEWHGHNEGKVLANLDFFRWLKEEYGMQLDIYLMDAATLDQGPGCAGSEPDLRGIPAYSGLDNPGFLSRFPHRFDLISDKAASFGCRLGLWLGPDGFGNTEQEARQRIHLYTKLGRDYHMALFKFDACCSDLRPEKENYFIEAMTEARKYSPDLIALNHRISFSPRALPYLTTFLWEGAETYVDVFSANEVTAPHHRVSNLSRGLPPDLRRLTEDHGVCISSCLEAWDDDLVLQAFNRCLILAPEVYGNPWLLRDTEFAKLARIYNLHRQFRDILVTGMPIETNRYGEYAVSRGNGKWRFLTLRNLSWTPVTRRVRLDESIGLDRADRVEVRTYHPTERILGTFSFGSEVPVEVLPFRAAMIAVTKEPGREWGITGCDYQVVKDIPGKPVQVTLQGVAGQEVAPKLVTGTRRFKRAELDGKNAAWLLRGAKRKVIFPGQTTAEPWHCKLVVLEKMPLPASTEAIFEAVWFAADNNALEARSLRRSGPTQIPAVKAARDAYFTDQIFLRKGPWDYFAFDSDPLTSFKVRRYGNPQDGFSVEPGILRVDFGSLHRIDTIRLLGVEADYRPESADVSADLVNWRKAAINASSSNVTVTVGDSQPVRYLRVARAPLQVSEIEAVAEGRALENRLQCRASNLFPAPSSPKVAWGGSFTLKASVPGSYLCVAVPGKYGKDNAIAVLRVGGRLVGAPDRAPSYVSNHWEHTLSRGNGDYTFYFPIQPEWAGQKIEAIVLGLGEKMETTVPEVWLTAHSIPHEEMRLVLFE
ncbi:MAG TPA: hypothetical protein VEC99_04925 [Clostridia bacterium]|nr:hypothetical protein [Clostridia bacterium]